jgi:uncharacterized lipoprotein YmbA
MLTLFIRIRLSLIAVALLAVAGCGTTPPSTFYQLEETASTQLSGLERGIAVGVGPVNLATYLDRPQIVIRGVGHQLELSEFNRWVEPLTDSISRVIIVNLSNMLESTRVYKIPRRNKTIPLEFRIEIDIARFDGMLGGDALLVGRWTLYGRQDKALVTKVSIIREFSGGEGFDSLIAAQNRALQNLSREIVASIRKNR